MRIYISGPITGRDIEVARREFEWAADALRASGHEPVDPMAEVPYNPGWTWRDYMRADIRLLVDCDAVALLPKWEWSRGAELERDIAERLGMKAEPVAWWLS